MHIYTSQVITVYNVKYIPVTNLVIKYIGAMSSEQGNKPLKYKERTKFHCILLNGLQLWTIMTNIIMTLKTTQKIKIKRMI